jgi:hypothetical protein
VYICVYQYAHVMRICMWVTCGVVQLHVWDVDVDVHLFMWGRVGENTHHLEDERTQKYSLQVIYCFKPNKTLANQSKTNNGLCLWLGGVTLACIYLCFKSKFTVKINIISFMYSSASDFLFRVTNWVADKPHTNWSSIDSFWGKYFSRNYACW